MIGLRIARIQPPHHGHLDAIQQAFSHGIKKLIIGIGSSDKSHTQDNPFSIEERHHMLGLLLEKNGLLAHTEIYHLPDFPDDAQRTQHIAQTVPAFTHIISDNPRVNELFNDKIIIQPQNNLPIRASEIRKAIIKDNNEVLQHYLDPQIQKYLDTIQAIQRIKNS